jgi:endo-1,4-beta-xylanase
MKWPAGYEAISPDVDKALDWLLERGFRVRGHNLIWPSWKWSPKQLRQYESNPDELRRRTDERVSSTVAHFKGKLVHWDVVNEPYSEHDLLDILGKDVMVEWFKLAKAADPACQMYLNDFGIFDGTNRNDHREHFYSTIKWLKESGAPIDGIGIQSHFGSVLVPPTQLLAVLDRFSEFGLPIESTELSLNLDDRALQADFMRDYMIALFSHPNVSGVMLWGFWEGRHWRPQASLWDKDWKPRPVADAWINLVHKQWKTKAELATDAQGVAKTRGFLGEYDVVVTLGPKSKAATVRLECDGSDVTVILE